MPRQGKRLSGPLVVAVVVLLVLVLAGFMAGAVGSALLGQKLPAFLSVPAPHPRLPSEALFEVGHFPVTNTMLASWLTTILLLVIVQLATRKMSLIPRGLQNLFEMALETLMNFCQDVAGKENGRRFFPLVATIFLFVITNSWLSLFPGFGTVLVHTSEGEAELLRGANTDLNLPLALALMSFVFVLFWGITGQGFLRFVGGYLNFKRLVIGLGQLVTGKVKAGFGSIFYGLIDAFVGILELLSLFIRILSFTFRLFGNMTAGEILLLVSMFLVPFVIPTVFYGLELLVGFVQALIFAGLTLVFGSLAVTTAHEEHSH